jgi:DNA topoisomerase-1
MLEGFYEPFHKLIEKSGGIKRSDVAQAREVGIDPKTKLPVMARFGRYGPMLQLGNPDADDKEAPKPRFAPLPEGTKIETVTLEQALEMFKLPREVGKTADGKTMLANVGRFGPYVQVDKTYASIKDQDPLTITEAEAREAIEAKLKKDAAKYINQFESGISVVNGPYGPYITDGKKNAKIDKGTDPKKITEDQAKKILAEAPAKKNFRRRGKR